MPHGVHREPTLPVCLPLVTQETRACQFQESFTMKDLDLRIQTYQSTSFCLFAVAGCRGGCGPNAYCDKTHRACACVKGTGPNPVIGCKPRK